MQSFIAQRYRPSRHQVRHAATGHRGGGVAVGERVFDNGVVYRGEFARGRAQGEGALHLPEGTVFRGRFEDDLFVRGVVTYFGAVRVECSVRRCDRDACLEDFTFFLPSGLRVIGACGPAGHILRATVLDANGVVCGRFSGPRLTLPVPHRTGHVLIISRTWVYEGRMQDRAESRTRQPDGVEFGAEGVQLWTRGFGYLRLVPRADMVAKQLLRIYRRLFLFRESLARGHPLRRRHVLSVAHRPRRRRVRRGAPRRRSRRPAVRSARSRVRRRLRAPRPATRAVQAERRRPNRVLRR